jgi:hypothetical protein
LITVRLSKQRGPASYSQKSGLMQNFEIGGAMNEAQAHGLALAWQWVDEKREVGSYFKILNPGRYQKGNYRGLTKAIWYMNPWTRAPLT